MWDGRLDVKTGAFNGELDGLSDQAGIMSDSDGLQNNRNVDGVWRWSQSGQDVLNGLNAAEKELC